MAVGDVLRLFVIVAGVYMFLKAILSLAKRKMTEPFCLAWAVLSALMILSGIILNPSQLDRYVSLRAYTDHDYCIRNSVGAVVYQHTGIQSEKEKSGACHADLAVKS